MRTVARNHRALAGAAHRSLDPLASVHAAVARAQVAVFEMTVPRLGALPELAACGKREIGRLESHVPILRRARGRALTPVKTSRRLAHDEHRNLAMSEDLRSLAAEQRTRNPLAAV